MDLGNVLVKYLRFAGGGKTRGGGKRDLSHLMWCMAKHKDLAGSVLVGHWTVVARALYLCGTPGLFSIFAGIFHIHVAESLE